MAKREKKPDPRTEAVEREEDPALDADDRKEELGTRDDIETALLALYIDVEKGFEGQQDRINSAMDYWDIYNCKLTYKQYYNGNSKIFLPIVHDAVNARAVRFTNQIFPQAGRYIEVTTEEGTKMPYAEMSLIEHYIRRCKLRTVVVPALCRNGDVEGHYHVYVSWKETKRHVTYKKQTKLAAGAEPMEDIEHETITEGRPDVEVIADSDVCVLPATAETIEDALANGGSVTILRRWSKAKIEQMIEDEDIIKEAGEALLEEMAKEKNATNTNKAKQMVDAAGIKEGEGAKYALAYETWTELMIGNERRLCRAYYGSEKIVLSCKRNPNWNDRCSLISAPVEKVQGSFKGKSKLQPVEQTQYYANDIINEAADSSMYSMLPIIMTDPEKNPRIGSMVLSLAAVWETSPNDTQFAKFPDLWKSGFEIIGSCKAQIMQTLSVSPAAITQSTSGKNKPSQADVAREQQIDILTTSDACTVLEEGILTPTAKFMIELDHQHRKDKILIRQFGEMGLKAKMDWAEPIQMDKKYSYRWFGVEQARNQMQMQQQIAAVGTIMKVPPQMYQGYKLNLAPAITNLMESVFGPRLAPQIFVDEARQITLDAELENEFLQEGHELHIHPMDQDPQHMQVHLQLLKETGDPTGNIMRHIQLHMVQRQLKTQAMMMQRMQQMMGTQPGGHQAGGGGGRGGAQVRGPRGNAQNPPGAIHRDQLGPASGQPPQLRQRGM